MDTETTGIPTGQPRPRGREQFASLQEQPYRRFIASQFLATIALWTQRVAADWAVMELTGSITLVGFLVVFQFGPTLLFGMWGGVLVDRYPTRTILIISQSVALAVGTVLAVTAQVGALSTWLIFACTGCLGLAAIVDEPARQVRVSQLVPRTALANAISMKSISFQIGGILGPALSGFLLATAGVPWAFTAYVALQAMALVALILALAPTRHLTHPRAPRARGQISSALRYAWRKPDIRWTLLLLVFVCTVGLNWPVVLVAMTTSEFHSGPTGYGLATSAMAVGSLAGGILSLRRVHQGLRSVVVSVAWFSACRMLCALAPVEWAFLGTLAAAGICLVLMWTAANALLQWSSNETIRGRIMSLYLMIAVGAQALGGPLLGWSCATIGPRTTLLISAAIPLTAAIVLALTVARRPRLGRGDLPERGADAGD